MPDLTPEERRRIYEEEKARIEGEARASEEKGQLSTEEAEDDKNKVAERSPTERIALIFLGLTATVAIILLFWNQVPTSTESYNDSVPPRLLLTEAKRHLSAGQYLSAGKLLKELIDIHSDSILLVEEAKQILRDPKTQEAIVKAEREYARFLARWQERFEKDNVQETSLSRQSFRDTPQFLLQNSKERYELGDLGKALRQLEWILREYPDTDEAPEAKVLISKWRGEKAKASQERMTPQVQPQQGGKARQVQPQQRGYQTDPHTAYIMMQQFVERRLKSPKSADFPYPFGEGGHTHVKYVGNQKYSIDSWVDAQNAFGADIRTRFKGKVKQVGTEEWKLVELTFDE